MLISSTTLSIVGMPGKGGGGYGPAVKEAKAEAGPPRSSAEAQKARGEKGEN